MLRDLVCLSAVALSVRPCEPNPSLEHPFESFG